MSRNDMGPPAKRHKGFGHLPQGLRDAKRKDIDNWETNRMLTSGVAQRRDHAGEGRGRANALESLLRLRA